VGVAHTGERRCLAPLRAPRTNTLRATTSNTLALGGELASRAPADVTALNSAARPVRYPQGTAAMAEILPNRLTPNGLTVGSDLTARVSY